MVPASEGLYKAIAERFDRARRRPVLAQHLENAVARDTGRGWRLDKQKAKQPMDAAIALAIAWFVCQEEDVVSGRRPSISVL
jgi:phage terminase large subunit-like protein